MPLRLAGSQWPANPVSSERASLLLSARPKRPHVPPVALADSSPICGVILPHDHYDHLDRATVKVLVLPAELSLAPLDIDNRLLAWDAPLGKVYQLDW